MYKHKINPIIKMDYPEPDVIRVEDTYYMIATTKHFMPGGVILRSYDLKNWEIVTYLFDYLENSPGERMAGEYTYYGQGMESGCIRYYKDTFYVCFYIRSNDKTYLFTSKRIAGPWDKHIIDGGFYNGSLFFEEDRVYMVYGYSTIWLTELRMDMSGVKKDGLHRVLLEEKEDVYVGYAAPKLYKIGNQYYVFVMHWPKKEGAMRTQLCFISDSLEKKFTGREVFSDDGGYRNQGIAQGGIVDAPNGKWYSILFQDRGAAGRMPFVIPVIFRDGFPEFGIQGKAPGNIEIVSSRPYYRYQPMYCSDSFQYVPNQDGSYTLKKPWQWNHACNPELWRILPEGGIAIKTGKISTNVIHAQNTLTQPILWPESYAEVWVDASMLHDGDVAGICALQGCYGLIGIQREMNQFSLVMITREIEDSPMADRAPDYLPGNVLERRILMGATARLRVVANLADGKDTVDFYSELEGRFIKLGKSHRLFFKLDHFTGCRYGLFVYSTKKAGGEAVFSKFQYH